jgi:glucosamine--fructose-6-phosphate aminotransferase (isomerizing)
VPLLRQVAEEAGRRKVRSVVIAARGTSDHAGTYGRYLLEIQKGIPVSLAAPSVLTLYQGALDLSDSLVIGISQSGKAADVLEVMRRGRENGAVVVSMTNDAASPMAQFADYAVDLCAGPERSVAATKTFGAQLFAMALLSGIWSGDEAFLRQLEGIPAALEETLRTLPAQLDETVPRYRFLEEGFVLARGIGYPIALETALKIQETNYIRMKSFPVSDFYHGPMALLHAGFPVILFAAEGPAYDDAYRMARRIAESSSDLLWVTDAPPSEDERIRAVFDETGASFRTIHLPRTGNDALSAFVYAVFAQMFACRLAVIRGLDPDNPRLLRKVTITR